MRGSYRSLSLVIYGNTAEDLGQFNIEVDLDSSLTNTVCAIEGDLDDLPPALHPTNLKIEESIAPLKAFSLKIVASDISVEMKQFLQLTFKIMELSKLGDAVNTVVDYVVSAASTFATHCTSINQKQLEGSRLKNCGESYFDLTEPIKELMCIYNSFQHDLVNSSDEFLTDSMFIIESEEEMCTSKQLVEILSQCHISSNLNFFGLPQLSQVFLIPTTSLFSPLPSVYLTSHTNYNSDFMSCFSEQECHSLVECGSFVVF